MIDHYSVAAPLNLANSPSLHLLTPAEQALCSQLRILPKPYLVIKETLVREYARRGGKLRRREARDLVKIDVNKTSRVWDFLVQAGYLKITQDPLPVAPADPLYVIFYHCGLYHSQRDGRQSHTTLNPSPSKDQAQARISPNPATKTTQNGSSTQPKPSFASPSLTPAPWPPSQS